VTTAATLELTYRSDAALLIAYATHIARGSLSVDLDERLPAGAPVQLKLVTPASSIAVAAVVTRPRGEPAEHRADPPEGPPAAPRRTPQVETTVAITPRSDHFGEAIDKLAFGFKGLKALVAASQAAPRALLIRYMKSIVSCEVIEIDQRRLAEPGAICNVDLGVIDLDSSGTLGYELYARLREHREAGSAPVLAVAQLERDRARAAALGFDEALANPPGFGELQAAALRVLAKPLSARVV
jgi:CheY-like chemotaxis protein